MGRYKLPRILDAQNLRAASRLLQHACFQHGDFEFIERWVDPQTLVYFDPPYRPISPTAHFRSYSLARFDDHEQLRLANFYRRLDSLGAKLMLSNSDPQNIDPNDDFFQQAYAGFRIERLQARRNINSVPDRRGTVTELLILNY
jgi:DNA adenine methylase